MTRSLLDLGCFDRVMVLDIGVSDGIMPQWRVFGDRLHLFGFDPWVEQIVELSERETFENIQYIETLIGLTDESHWYLNGPASKQNPILSRSSAAAASGIHPDELRARPRTMSDDKVSLDDFVKLRDVDDVDFIKIDTDGDDFECLLSCEKTIKECGVLGLSVESNFHGPADPRSNTFDNVDRWLREKGFLIYDLSLRTHSRASLPLLFRHGNAGSTHGGQITWGDAIYFLDPVDTGVTDAADKLGPQKILKLASFYELHAMPDCAAELLLAQQDVVAEVIDVQDLLNLLTPELGRKELSYEEYMAAFWSVSEDFYPARNPPEPTPTNAEVEALTESLTRLKAELLLKEKQIEATEELLRVTQNSFERTQYLYTEALRREVESDS